MVIKTLKGRSFGGLLDYLFDAQDKPPPEIEARAPQKIKKLTMSYLRLKSVVARQTGPVRLGPASQTFRQKVSKGKTQTRRRMVNAGTEETSSSLIWPGAAKRNCANTSRLLRRCGQTWRSTS